MTDPRNVLFLGTGNRARSILAEALLNGLGGGRFRAHSAGSRPAGELHPRALALIRDNRLPSEGLRSKHRDEYAAPDAPRMDFVFTLCDDAAREPGPRWPGQPLIAHWGIDDPGAVAGDDALQRRAFLIAFNELRNRIAIFTSLPIDKLERAALQGRLDDLGRTRGAETA